uniref:Phosphomevalonate kinase n=1 Tax=Panagrolaimus superbus TaxID=310955 RepID=A0A914XSU8_9BILA
MKAIFCLFGKRKSGKDYCAEVLKTELNKNYGHAEIRRISDPLKEEYAALKGLDSSEELKTSGPLKEVYRAEMIKFGEDIRVKDYGYFCCKSLESIPSSTEYLIISDCRRPTDLGYFKSKFSNVFVIKIIADLKSRTDRGFIHCPEIDDAESECALDGFQDVDAVINNNNNDEKDERLKEKIKSLLAKIL